MDCKRCGGDGIISSYLNVTDEEESESEICSDCGGSGKEEED